MYKTVILAVMAMFIMSGEACSGTEIIKGIEVYTFKKKRVDQELVGNRGYLSGKPENIISKERSDERVMIGIDVELPSSIVGEGSKAKKDRKKAKKALAEEKAKKKVSSAEEEKKGIPEPQEVTTLEMKEEVSTPYDDSGKASGHETEEIDEEEWIK
ncbi:MAG: hypothetical protein P9L90_07805 [Candidatus Aadella gelida]|nr:hypothetical protein [Candidatus Aadella gelida]